MLPPRLKVVAFPVNFTLALSICVVPVRQATGQAAFCVLCLECRHAMRKEALIKLIHYFRAPRRARDVVFRVMCVIR